MSYHFKTVPSSVIVGSGVMTFSTWTYSGVTLPAASTVLMPLLLPARGLAPA